MLAVELKPSLLCDLVHLPPVKIVQTAVDILIGASCDRIAVSQPTSNGLANPRLGLVTTSSPDSTADLIAEPNAKATKSDDATTNVAFWDLGTYIQPVECKEGDFFKTWPYLTTPDKWKTTAGLFIPSGHGVLFEFL